jgi:hypothetical protein
VINAKNIIQSSSPTANITVNSTPIASVPRATSPTISPTSPTIPPSSPSYTPTLDHRPVAISIFLWLTFADLVYKIVSSVLAIVKFISNFRANHLLAHIFETSPLLSVSPFVFAIIAVIILFLIFKTSAYSRSDRILLIIFSLLLPIVVSWYLLQISTSLNIHPTLAYFNETNLLFLILFIFLLVFSRHLSTESQPLTDGPTITLALLGSLILFPSFFFTYYLINTSLNPDIKHDSIQSLVGYKLYTPTVLPLNLRPDTTFYVDEQKNTNFTSPLVKIAYSTPVTSLSSTRPMVIISQTKVIPEFDLDNYMNSQLTTSSTKSTPLEISTALNRKALIKSSNSEATSLQITSLSFITPDYILVNLITPNSQTTKEQLQSIAESLR